MTVRRDGLTAVLALASLAIAACSTPSGAGAPGASTGGPQASPAAQASPQAAGTQVISLTTGDYYFKPDEVTLKTGSVTVTLLNEGPRLHTFYVRNLANTDDIFKTRDRLPAGESETVTFTLSEPGRYKFYCAIPGHEDRGEVGWFTVTS
jgi:uncharacterized cupredoxin-like copper-binding protein